MKTGSLFIKVVLPAQGALRTDDDNEDDIVASLVAQTVKNLPATQETQVQSLGWEDCLENPMDRGVWRAAKSWT